MGSAGSICDPVELYADLLDLLTTDQRHATTYWSGCKSAHGFEQEALNVVRGAAEGRMPSWFAATYHGANGEPDLERLWADVKGISASKSRAATVFQLRNEFGGYCDRRKATKSAFENGVTRNPWRDGGCVPAAPRDVAATAVGGGKLTVSWDPPADDGGSPIEGYKVQWKSGTEAYDSSRQAEVTDLERLSHTIESLTSGVDHSVRVVAYNHNGGGADSVETTATAGAQDTTAPQLSAATADGASLVLTWNETLDETSVPVPGAFEVSAGGTARGIGRVSVTGNRVTLTLTSAVAVGEAVTLSYAVPAGGNASPLRDTAMNAAAGLSGHAVRNDTTAVTIVSDPGADVTYIFHYGHSSQDVIELTVTFSERVTVTGVPELALQVGTVTKQAAYAGGSGTTALTFRYVVADGDTDPNGVSVPAGRIGGGGTIKYVASNAAAPARVSLAAQPGHRVDGVRPALVSIRAVANGNVLTLTWDKVLDENSVPGWGDNRGFQLWDLVDGWHTPGPPRDEITAVSISGAVVTLELSSAIQSGDQLVVSYTVPYKTYPPLLDTLGNYAGNNRAVIAIAASESSNTPPTGLPAISGTAQVGATLTASADAIVDADGLENVEFAWQWIANDGAADADITGATAATYTLTAADLGNTIKVRVTFTDDGGTEETLVSAATVAVAETQPPVPEITLGGGGFTVDEGETMVTTLTMQQIGQRGSDSVWSIPQGADGGEDADAFTLEPDGVLSFRTAKDYESPDDVDGDGEYEVTAQFGTRTASARADLVISLRNVNEAPVADAGADIAGVSPGASVTLDGSGSSDPDRDDTLTWRWTQTDASGYAVVLSDAAAKRPTFTIPSDIAAEAVLVFTLRVTDAGGLFAEDSVRVSVVPPPADAPAGTTEVLWSGDVTVTDYGGAFGAITADSFTNVTGGELGVEWIWYSVGVRRLDLILSEAATAADELTLHLDDVALAFPQGSSGESVIRWRPIRLSWRNGQTVAMRVTRTSQAPEPVNTSPTGLPAIAGTPRVGEALRASVSGIADEDGLSGATFGYQWLSHDGTADTAISGATQAVYTLAASDAGNTIKVRVSFTDDGGTEEALTSAATVVVQDLLTLSVSDGSATEGDAVEFTVSLSAASGRQVTVHYASAGGTAESGADFTAASGTLTFAANETSKTVSVATTADAADEDNETFTLRLSNALGATLADAEATGTIVNDDEPEDTVSPTVLLQCVDMEANPHGFQAQMSDNDTLWWELNFSELVRQADDTGARHVEIAGQDDTDFASWLISGGVAFYEENGDRYDFLLRYYTKPKVPRPDGSPSADVSEVNGVVITVRAGGWQDRSGNLNTASANSLYLAHNWKVSAADASATEGTDGTIDFEVTLNARDDCETVTVDWVTADRTATAGEDYTAANGTLSFGPGETSKMVSVVILDDTVEDSGETLTLQLSNASGVTLADAEATGTISDEESPFVSMPQIDGVPQVGNTLEVSFAEPPSGAFAYQWLRGSEVIAGATASTYVPTVADVGARLSVRVERGGETRTSAPTAPVEATVPDAPRSLALAVPDGREGVLRVSWDAPLDDGGSAVTAYTVQWKEKGAIVSVEARVTDLANLTYTITGLTNGVPYRVRVIATSGVGDGAATAGVTGTPRDRVRPELAAAAVDGETLTLTWSEALDEGSTPWWYSFDVSVRGAARGITAVSVSGSTVSLTLASAVAADDVVTVSYTVPAAPDAPRIKDTAGNAAAAFSGAAVTNNTSDPVNTPPTGLPAISGTARVGATLTASVSEIADEDGLGGATFTYQWIRSDGTTDTDIADATQISYTLVAADQGKTITVRATFIDDGGTEEALTSAATAVVQDSLTLSVSDARATEGALVEFTVSLSAASSQQVTVQYATSGVTAQSGTDFTAASGTLTFAANETSKTVSVATTADAADEENETFTLTLSSPTNATLGDATATGTINDDEPEDTVSPTVSVQCVDMEAYPLVPQAQMSDNDTLSWELNFSELVRRADDTGARDLEIAGQDDTDFSGWVIGWGSLSSHEENGHHYRYRMRYFLTPKVPRPDGSASADVSEVNGVVITVPAGWWQDRSGNLNTASANSLYLAHNWKVSAADASATEGTDGTIEFEVTLNARDDCETVTVDWVTADGSATAGEDYIAANGTLTFGPGETSKTLSVVILDDTVEDSGETFTLRLSNASRVTLADAEATGTISDKELPFVSVPQIDGVPQVGNTLEMSFAEPPSGALAYQWLRGSEVIAGATASTYVPTVADVGARLSVRVERGGETRTSAPTAPVWPGPANPPLADGEEELLSATVTLGSHQFPYWVAGYGRVLGESFGEMDVTSFEDGGATYVINAFLVNSRGVFALATGSTLPDASGLVAYWNGYRISGLETEQAKRGTLPMLAGRTPQPSTEYARYEDGASDGVRVAVSLRRVTNNTSDSVNTPPTGLPAVSGTARVGETLTASVSEIADEDGLGGATFTYRWIRSDGTTDTDIADATQVSYTLVAADQGKTITVRATFIDDGGTEEALTSAATAVVQDFLTLSVSDGSATEGDAVEFTVSLSAASGRQVTVHYASAGGTAESGADFTAASGTLTFAANETSKTVSVATTADAADEDNETFTLRLSNALGATLADAEATGTIVNDDEPEDTVSPTVSVQCVDPDASLLGPQVSGNHSLSWELHFSEPVTHADDTSARSFEIAGQDDTDFSWLAIGGLAGSHLHYRYFTTPVVSLEDRGAVSDVNGVVITVPAGGWQDRPGNLNTASANSLYLAHNWKVSAADASATEGTDGTIEFEVTLNARDDCETVTVDWVTADGTATAGEDYTAANGTLSFGPGETSKMVSVVILDDTVEDSGETLTLQLSNPSGATLADAEATGTISDEESPFVSMPQIDGVPQVGNTLEVSFAEPPSGAFAYQWLRGSEVIAGATASTYVPTVADVGARLSVRVERGGETRTSAPTAPVEATVPDAPRSLALAVPDGREGVLRVSWDAPLDDGGSAVTAYTVQWKEKGAIVSVEARVTDLANLTYTITGLTNGVPYRVRVIATNGVGDGAATAGVTGTPRDRVRPELAAAAVDGETLTLSWSEALDEGSMPAANAFAVSVAGVARGVTEVAVAGSAVTLTLAAAVTADDVVTVGYTVPALPAAPRIEDAAGNAAAAFSGAAVTNNTAAPVNTPPTGLPTISGTARVGETLTASETGIADADGLSGATYAWQWIANDGSADAEIAGATGATCTLTAAELGKTVKVQVTFTDDGGTQETLVSAATGQVSAALMARFENVPERHDGATAFAVRIAFSEAVTTGVAAFGDHAAEVTDGSVTGARRIDGRSDLWELSVEPASDAEVTLALPADRACDAAGALCTADGGRLSNRPEATIAGPLPAISIAAGTSPVAEGTAAAFTLSRGGDTAAALTVAVVVAEDGAALMGAPSANVTFAVGAGTAELAVATDDDETAESASTVTATLEGGDGYAVDADAASASVTVADDDAAPVVTTATPIAAPENGTTVATLVATDADTPAADLAWTIAGGADADKFTLTAAGVLAFKAAPDFEAPDDAGADGEYEVTVTVTDGANPVEAELTVRLTDVDDVAPVLTGASVDGATVTLTFDEPLDETSLPPAGAFAVTVGTASRGVSGVSVDGSATLLTLASAVTADDTVAVTYSVPAEGSARIRDTVGNAAAGFSRQAVTNATPVANTPPTGQPAIAGTPLVGATLTASAHGIEDADGLAGAVFAWQWIVNDGSGDADIAGATEASYTLTAAEAGKRVKVRVTFTDGGGTEETLLSAATATVSAPLPEVSIAAAASPVTEGSAAVFVLRRSGATTSALTVTVSVTEAGDVLDGAAPSSVTFAENTAEARLRIATEDDAAAEADARVTATVAAGAGYRVAAAAASAGVDVFDDEQAPSSAAVTLWSGELEVGTYGGWIGALGDAVDDNGWTEDGFDYALDYVIYVPGELLIGFTRAPEEIDGLTLHFGEVELALAGAGSGTTYAWSVELDWEPGMTVAVRLNRRGAAPAPARACRWRTPRYVKPRARRSASG